MSQSYLPFLGHGGSNSSPLETDLLVLNPTFLWEASHTSPDVYVDNDDFATWRDRVVGRILSSDGLTPVKYKTNILNGLPVARFNAGIGASFSAGIDTTSFSFLNKDSHTIIIVFKMDAALANNQTLINNNSERGTVSGISVRNRTTDNHFVYFLSNQTTGNTNNFVTHTQPVVYGAFHILALRFENGKVGDDLTMNIDGDQQTDERDNPPENAANTYEFKLGVRANFSDTPHNWLGGDIATVGLWNSALSDTDFARAIQIMKNKYNL